MQAVLRFLRSPIGQKVMMALTGLSLVLFLIVHMSGNLLVFKSADEFNSYSHGLVSSWLIYLAEAGLIFLFGYHAVNGVLLVIRNRKARPEGYVSKRFTAGGASRKSLASTLMPLSGLLLLIFVVVHVATMKYGTHYATTSGGEPVRDLYRLVVEKFSNPWWTLGYVGAMVIVGMHLWHGLANVMMTLGLRHKSGLMWALRGLCILIAGGFMLVPVLVFLTASR